MRRHDLLFRTVSQGAWNHPARSSRNCSTKSAERTSSTFPRGIREAFAPRFLFKQPAARVFPAQGGADSSAALRETGTALLWIKKQAAPWIVPRFLLRKALPNTFVRTVRDKNRLTGVCPPRESARSHTNIEAPARPIGTNEAGPVLLRKMNFRAGMASFRGRTPAGPLPLPRRMPDPG